MECVKVRKEDGMCQSQERKDQSDDADIFSYQDSTFCGTEKGKEKIKCELKTPNLEE